MVVGIRTFFDLLPCRIDQALVSSAQRKRRAGRQRRKGVEITTTPGVARRLFVDVAVISKIDAGTGIQRVVRALALGLNEEAPEGWTVHFVSAARHTRYEQICWLGHHDRPATEKVEGRPGDVFLGLDYSLNTIRWHRSQLERFQRDGGKIWFLVHDLLPLQRPDWFSRNTVVRYAAWLDIIAGLADGFLCNSRQTEIQLKQVLRDRYGIIDGYSTGIVPMGASVRDSMLDNSVTQNRTPPSQLELQKPFYLMVGTLEPRKGHLDVISAFGELWKAGRQDRLVIVGRLGWHVDDLRHQILSHSEYGRNLIWLNDVDDWALEQIYASCEGLIMASHAEGFGLPLLEALGHGKPVLARDLEVFRQHEEFGVRYFPANANAELFANYIMNWIDDVREQAISVAKPDACWRTSAKLVFQFVQ